VNKLQALNVISPAFYSGRVFVVKFDTDKEGVAVPENLRGRVLEVSAHRDTGACVIGDYLCMTVNDVVLTVPFSAILSVRVQPFRLIKGGKS
jgi:cell division ATPase FtsA